MIIIYYVLMLFQLAILARVLLSWFPNIDRDNPIVRFLYQVTEPVLKPVRDLLPNTAGIDFSPLIVLLIISVLIRFIF